MKRIVLIVAAAAAVVFAAGRTIGHAQTTHPCDVVVGAATPGPAPVGAGFCHSGKDVNGNPTTITKFIVKVDGVIVFNGPLTPIGSPSSTGLNYYETPKNIIPTVGSHTITVAAVNASGTGAATAAYPFDILESLPEPVLSVRIIR
jgi:hypothetical protein